MSPEEAKAVRVAALKLLARREHGAGELAAKLEAKGHPEALVRPVIEQLRSERLLSDDRFAEALTHVRESRGYGPVRVGHELREKGVMPEAIDQALAVVDWLAVARAARVKKFGAGLPRDMVERARQTRFLNYRGFTPEQIRRVLGADDDA